MRKMHVLLISILGIQSPVVSAKSDSSFQFFDGKDIDYWNEGKRVHTSLVDTFDVEKENQSTEKKNDFSGANTIRSSDASPFDWKKYNNPRSPEFWDDGGDWIPPRPFREAAANPTTENINEYLQWQVRKTAIVERFQSALSKHENPQKRNEESKNEDVKKEDNTEKNTSSINRFNWSKLKVAYFYQTSCPHCRSSISVIERIKSFGAEVKFIQLDSDVNPSLHENSIAYDQDMDKLFKIKSTPTWYLKLGNKYTKIVGEQSISSVIAAIQKL